jgi:CRISPR-associated protein Cas1
MDKRSWFSNQLTWKVKSMQLRISGKDATLNLNGNRLSITQQDMPVRYFPLKDIQHVVIDGQCQLHSSLLHYCLEQDVPIIIESPRTEPKFIQGNAQFSKRIGVKQACYRITHDPELSFGLAQFIVAHKQKQQARSIQRLCLLYQIDNMDTAKAVANRRQTDVDNVSQLLGSEGAAAAAYFGALKHFFPIWCQFVKRQRRPPPDPANAILGLVYTLAMQTITRELLKAGFEPLFGVLHRPSDYRFSLSCDLLELFRAELDRWVINLLHTELSELDFCYEQNGECSALLNAAGKQTFYPNWYQYHKRLRKKIQRILRLIDKDIISYVP